MAQQGATLQNYNNELVKCIEDLREKREEVNRSIAKDEEEKGAPRPRTHHPCVASGAAGGGRGAHPCGAPRAPTLAAKIQNDLRILTERLARINDNLARKVPRRRAARSRRRARPPAPAATTAGRPVSVADHLP